MFYLGTKEVYIFIWTDFHILKCKKQNKQAQKELKFKEQGPVVTPNKETQS